MQRWLLMTEWMLIAGMAMLTFIPRYLPFGLAGRIHISPLMVRALHYVPIAVLSAIVSQATLMRGDELSLVLDNHHLIAAIVAFFVALISRHLFMTILCGLVTFGLARWLL
ncbi:MAG: branched-subunit amino acid transport protein [Gammaproteobacteria bacterium]|jgi:branched-subunit amino acid transport protein